MAIVTGECAVDNPYRRDNLAVKSDVLIINNYLIMLSSKSCSEAIISILLTT